MVGTARSGPSVPTALKIVRGNPGRRPLPEGEPMPPVPQRVPSPPAELSDSAKKIWRAQGRVLLKTGILTEIDAPMLAAVCIPYDNMLRCSGKMAELKANPWMVKDGVIAMNPLVRVMYESMDRFMRASAEFGMSPASRTRVKVAATEVKDDIHAFINRPRVVP